MKRLLAILLLGISTFTSAQSLQEVYTKSQESRKAGDIQGYYNYIMEAHALHPYHQGILYQCGLAAALSNKPEDAIGFLNKAIQISTDFSLDADELKSLTGRDDFKKLKQLQIDLRKTIVHSDTAFVIPEKTYHLESVTSFDAKTFFFGSIHKRTILKRDAKGKVSPLVPPGTNGLASVFGVRVDKKKKILWACASPRPEMVNYDSAATSALFKIDLATEKIVDKYNPVSSKNKFVFGDLCLDPAGNVYVSDSQNNIIFFLNEKEHKLEEFFSSDEIWSLQGMTFSDDEKYLFIADYIKGIFRLEISNKKLVQLTSSIDSSLKSIDGLNFYNNSLIAIQNGVTPMRVVRYTLDTNLEKITASVIIDRAHPAFGEPTIGCLVGNQFFYVANSLWEGYTEDHKLKAESELAEVVILKADLSRIR